MTLAAMDSAAHDPPPVPPKHDSPASAQQSPSVATVRGRVQPLGTTQQQRQQQQQNSPVVRKRSFSAGSGLKLHRSASLPGQNRSTEQPQRSNYPVVFCDVVIDDLDIQDGSGLCTYPPIAARFFDRLGTRVRTQLDTHTKAPPLRKATPRKESRPDEAAVRRHLRELHDTEKSYLVKIQSLEKHFARPLRTFARDKNTAVIDTFSAAHLFINIEQLVPISQRFERDLAQVKLFLTHTSTGLPPGFGDMILDNVRNMGPFRKWLAAYASADTLRRDLERTSSSFKQFVERKQVESREETGQTGGFTEFLAEPFQRVSRYRLMLDPIIAHLDPLDDNVAPLEQAIDLLTDICAMETDDATAKAATLWALMETIEGFPAAMIGFDRTFLGALDVDEVVDPSNEVSSSTSRASSLRCSLLLFSDKMMIVKRPSGAHRATMQQTGLGDPNALVAMYRASQLSSSSSSANVVSHLLSSPRKSASSSTTSGASSLKKNSLGYRGIVDLLEVESIDSDGEALTLLFDQPPMDLSSERWCGRPVRRFVVANTHGEDDDSKRKSKDKWMALLHDAQCKLWTMAGSKGVWSWKSDKRGSMAKIFWVAWDRCDWERANGGARNKTALYLDDRDGESPDLSTGLSANPQTIARAMPLGQDRVRFSVKSHDRTSKATETIPFERIVSAIAELGAPNLIARERLGAQCLQRDSHAAGSTRRPRPRSAIISAALDVFSGGASSLKRISSTTSRVSNATTTISWLSSTDDKTQVGSTIPSPVHVARDEAIERQKRLSQRSAPDLTDREARTQRLLSAEITSSDIQPVQQPATKAHARTLSLPCHGLNSMTIPQTDSAPFEDAPEDLESVAGAASAMEPALQPPRRRMMGPRAPGEARSSPVRLDRSPDRQAASVTPTRLAPVAPSTPDQSIDSVKRRLFEASPRHTPAKRASIAADLMPRGPSPSQSRRVPSSSGTARLPSSQHSRRIVSNRVVSGASTARGSPPPSASRPLPSETLDVFDDVGEAACLSLIDTRRPVDVLKSHVQELLSKISFDPNVGKENDRIVSPSGLSRSPHTRNVTLKAASTPSSSFATSFSDSRKATATVDVPALLRWTDKLSTLVDTLDISTTSQPSPLSGQPTKAEIELLEQERDLLMAENMALKEQAAKRDETVRTLSQALDSSQSETLKFRRAYEDILTEVSTAYDEFNERLDFVVLTLQQEAQSRDPEFTRLGTELVKAVKDKVEVERRLRDALGGRLS
ncbi:hypothetical protein OIV83_002322 [Microbotryomycetes sp. JL201]|nr:hypothetical protein OIV83_002322 [Microbotryomycetes sp. JL201]